MAPRTRTRDRKPTTPAVETPVEIAEDDTVTNTDALDDLDTETDTDSVDAISTETDPDLFDDDDDSSDEDNELDLDDDGLEDEPDDESSSDELDDADDAPDTSMADALEALRSEMGVVMDETVLDHTLDVAAFVHAFWRRPPSGE